MTQFDWTEEFNGTRNLPASVRKRLLGMTKISHFARGELLFEPSKIPDGLLLLLTGTVRVSQTSDTGREIVLYRVEAGQSCVLTTACMLSEEAYYAQGIAETDVSAVHLPRSAFDELAAQEESFRKFIFSAYSKRLLDLLRVVDDVAFGRIDVRLAERLLEISRGQTQLTITHQELAVELGTAREVITRVLQDFQKRGLLGLSRGKVEILEPQKLTQIAQSA